MPSVDVPDIELNFMSSLVLFLTSMGALSNPYVLIKNELPLVNVLFVSCDSPLGAIATISALYIAFSPALILGNAIENENFPLASVAVESFRTVENGVLLKN